MNLEQAHRLDESALSCVTRFAPSPTGRMHAGNIFASLVSWLLAKKTAGHIVLRIEDLDKDRSKQEFIDCLMNDYERLGLTWDVGPYYQASRDEAYENAYDKLSALGLIYPCFCTRADLHTASAPHFGQSRVYPGYCRNLTPAEQKAKLDIALEAGRMGPSYRVLVPTAHRNDDEIAFDDLFQGYCIFSLSGDSGDFVIRRADRAFAYQLAVVVDDAEQGINTVCRGIDLLDSVPRQQYLQNLLGYQNPAYAHVPILVAQDGRRLAKRNHDANIEALLGRFKSPEAVLGYIAGITGITETSDPASLDEILDQFDIHHCQDIWKGHISILWPSE